MMRVNPQSLNKSPTGIGGLDEITGGGIPQGRTTLVEGSPGAGKTVLALQTLVHGVRHCQEPGIFVAFEESSRQLMVNATTFGWDLPALQRKKLFFLDAQPSPDWFQSGAFDLGGMLAAIDVKVREIGARRIVFDAIDVVLSLLEDPAAEQREIYRLHAWLQSRGLTAILTAKAAGLRNADPAPQRTGFLQFMVDCAVSLEHELVQGVSQRHLRVIKYRGSGFSENQSPFLIGDRGLEVAGVRGLTGKSPPVTNERVSTGVARLDTMLGGGYHRSASVLITGSPGTAKSTLCGTFAQAACKRGEATLYVSFDSDPAEVVRNLASVNIRLGRYHRSGLLRMIAARTGMCSAEMHFLRIKGQAEEHGSRCLIIDPVSALSKRGNEQTAHSVVERLTDWAKAKGVTVLCTSLLEGNMPEVEGTPLQISTVADTWIHLSYMVHAGERNRALTIIKSRGTAHSNQVRELVLSDKGVTLADVYTAGGEVLMGTLRWEMEQAEQAEQQHGLAEARRKQLELELETQKLEAKRVHIERQLAAKHAEHEALAQASSQQRSGLARHRSELRVMRGADTENKKTFTHS